MISDDIHEDAETEASIMAELPFLSWWLFSVAWSFLAHRYWYYQTCLSLSSPSLPPYPLTYTLCHLHSLDIHKHRWHKKTPIWWINLYILEPIPVSASILMRPCLLLSRVPLQPSGVISLLAVLNSLIICVLHKKRTIPQWHITACWAWFGLALMWIGCCVVSAL